MVGEGVGGCRSVVPTNKTGRRALRDTRLAEQESEDEKEKQSVISE